METIKKISEEEIEITTKNDFITKINKTDLLAQRERINFLLSKFV